MLPDLNQLLLNPTGWEEDVYGIIHPACDVPAQLSFSERCEIAVTQMWGVEVRDDGEVFISEGGVRRQAEGWERIGLLRDMREAFGELVNIEPE